MHISGMTAPHLVRPLILALALACPLFFAEPGNASRLTTDPTAAVQTVAAQGGTGLAADSSGGKRAPTMPTAAPQAEKESEHAGFLSRPAVPKSRYVIGFSQATTTEPWRLFFNQELRAEAAKRPEVELLVRDGQDRVEKQIKDMEEFIEKRVDAILISPKVAGPLTPVALKAMDEGIPVFVMDRNLETKRFTQFIGADNHVIGQFAGEYAVKRLGGPGKARGGIVEIWGGMGTQASHDRHNGFYEVVSREPGITILNKPSDGDWKQDRGFEIMSQALAAHPKIDLVYAQNDPMAYGAYLAAKSVGREKEMLFLGVDGIPAEGVTWVHAGVLTATFLYPTPGAEALRQALAYLKGQPIPRRVTLPTMRIDHSNAADVLRANGLLK